MEIAIDLDALADQVAKKLDEEPKVWDDYVPIAKDEDSNVTHIYLYDGIHAPGTYAEMCHTLRTATAKDRIHLHINNGGGYEASADSVVDAIHACRAPVIAHLSGLVASAATVITMACDDIVVSPNVNFMIHESSFEGMGGKFSDLKSFQSFYAKHTVECSKRTYGGFLTDDEIEAVHKGQEMWMGRDEILERWEWKLKHAKA